jgi:hypothetical protein
VFALAALTATLFPNGTVVRTNWNGPWVERGWGIGGGIAPVPMPVPFPAMPEPGIVEEDVPDVFLDDVDVSGDVVGPDGTLVGEEARPAAQDGEAGPEATPGS